MKLNKDTSYTLTCFRFALSSDTRKRSIVKGQRIDTPWLNTASNDSAAVRTTMKPDMSGRIRIAITAEATK
ncbi:MAG: hypothetical protein R2795_11710 [Saprospiraceae bacterium]